MEQLFIIEHQRKAMKVEKGDIYLADSGGQYNYGTTDVTRTISLNNNSKKDKEYFYKSFTRPLLPVLS